MTLLDWKIHGRAYAETMAATARALADSLGAEGIPVFARERGVTRSHQFAIEAAAYGGGQTAAQRLRRANILTCGIGLPAPEIVGDVNGLRIGTPEIVRWGMDSRHMPELAKFIARGLSEEPEKIAPAVTEFRQGFNRLHFVR
jgi:glycine hydroxymethyltransferase